MLNHLDMLQLEVEDLRATLSYIVAADLSYIEIKDTARAALAREHRTQDANVKHSWELKEAIRMLRRVLNNDPKDVNVSTDAEDFLSQYNEAGND